jgi:glutathione S-transferase
MAMLDKGVVVYGSKISYFTGKLEGYLRYKGIAYQFKPMKNEYFNTIIPAKTGAQQMPAVELMDGRWMTDTTPMIQWMEHQCSDNPVMPTDPLQAFICLLIEDYCDEWLWRPAMYYRWSYRRDRHALSAFIVDELFSDVPAPYFLKKWKISQRQKGHFVDRDGVTSLTRQHVENSYLSALKLLQGMLQNRSYLLGDKPSLADFGFFGPMFRHFASDPTPREIMQETAPEVFEWVSRLWNAKAESLTGQWLSGIPEDWMPLLKEIGETHLQNLCANAEAYASGRACFDVEIQGVTYQQSPTSRYRVWCLEQLRSSYMELPADIQISLKHVLEQSGCWEPLWRIQNVISDYDPDKQAPFNQAIKVYPVKGA